jgi:hypothetical protein
MQSIKRTCICLNSRGNLTSTNVVEEGDILAQNSLQIAFTDAFGVDFASVNPDVHVRVCTDKHADTYLKVNLKPVNDVEFGHAPMITR